MRKLFAVLMLLAGLIFDSPQAYSAEQVVTLDVKGMYCRLCASTVKWVIMRVDGVIDAKVSAFENNAVIRFDDTKCDVKILEKAVANWQQHDPAN